MANNFVSADNSLLSREDFAREYAKSLETNQGYHSYLNKIQADFKPLLGGKSPFSFEGWNAIIRNDSYFKKLKATAANMFAGDEGRKKTFEHMLDKSRDVALMDHSQAMEGWGGSNAIYAASQGGYPAGTLPFVIGGWLATARSQEAFNIIEQDNMRLQFEYMIDYLMVGDKKYYYPKAFRSGEMVGFNELPTIDWVTPNIDPGTGVYNQPEPWCDADNFIDFDGNNSVKGNLLTVSGFSTRNNGIEPDCLITSIRYNAPDGAGGVVEEVENTYDHYDVSTGATEKRIFKKEFKIRYNGSAQTYRSVFLMVDINLDTGDFVATKHEEPVQGVIPPVTDDHLHLLAFKIEGRVSNIANEMAVPTMGVEKLQFVRECYYKLYANVGLNEFMMDNFQLGNDSIAYPAYATDRLLQFTVFNRELEAEQHFTRLIDTPPNLDHFELTRKMGGFVNNQLQFSINKMTPGIGIQEYKNGLKMYLNKTLAAAETELNIPKNVKREWIFFGYDAVISEFPEIKFQNAVVNLNDNPENGGGNENFGFATGTMAGYVDNIGRSVRVIGNTDSRWRDRGSNVYGVVKTHSMEYPFLVYYPYAIRMFTTIDANNPNRTAITLGGREYRGTFALAGVRLQLNGVLDANAMPVNNFEAQVADAKNFRQIP